MKHHLPLLTLLLLTATPSFALDQVFLEPVQPVSPSLKAQGGVSTSNASGYDALFANPAAFADDTVSLTFLSLESTAHVPLSGINRIMDARDSWGNMDLLATGNPMRALVNDLITKSGIGMEVSTGTGWVGKNLGLGFATQTRVTAKGSSLLETKTVFDQTLVGVIGMAWPFDIGLGTLQLGGAIRPMQKTYSLVTVGDVLNNMANFEAYTLSTGFGLGLDVGVKWSYAAFQTGLAIRDASGTVFNFKEFKASQWISGYGFPSGGSSTGNTLYRVPMVIGLGTTWTPDMGTLASLFQPALTLDFQIPLKDEFTQPSFWTWVHLGAEAKLLRFVSVRTGLNQGYLTFGLGAKLFFVDFNLAIFADELGRYSGMNRRSGVSLEWAFRL